jgi:raffinose/stachyose/melibiose transport system permease protein
VIRSRPRPRDASQFVVAVVVTLLFVLPVYIALASAFKSQAQILSSPLGLPAPVTLDNLTTALDRRDHLVTAGVANSLVITVLSVGILIPLSSALSFWLSEQRPRIKSLLLVVFALGLMVPPQTVLLPIVQLLRAIGLNNSYPGLIMSNVGGGYLSFGVFVYVGFLRTIPRDLIEAARIDGASDIRVWWQIVLPLVRPATATVGIFLALWVWNDFLNPLFILGPRQGQTITTGIYVSLGTYSTDYGQLFGIMFLAASIPVVGYLLTQREFIRGLMAGASR